MLLPLIMAALLLQARHNPASPDNQTVYLGDAVDWAAHNKMARHRMLCTWQGVVGKLHPIWAAHQSAQPEYTAPYSKRVSSAHNDCSSDSVLGCCANHLQTSSHQQSVA